MGSRPRMPLKRLTAKTPPVISARSLAGIPALIRHAFGDKVLRQAKQAVMLDIELLEQHDCFIPYSTLNQFLAEVERRSGEFHVGLLVAPHLSVTRYGRWGEYIVAAESLGAAIARATSTLGYHSTGDRMQVTIEDGVARISYFAAMREEAGHSHVASGIVGVMLCLLHVYLPSDFRPRRIALDIPRPTASLLFEDAFHCPVVFGADAISLDIDAHLLERQANRHVQPRLITVEDVARALLEPVDLHSFLGVVVAQIRAQVQTGVVSIDSTARALGTSVRTLQRALHRDHGADFRDLVNATRMQRAKELLAGSNASITQIATAFGYATPANFARAFRNGTGMAPHEFRVGVSQSLASSLSPVTPGEDVGESASAVS